jgi:hypothetical protein
MKNILLILLTVVLFGCTSKSSQIVNSQPPIEVRAVVLSVMDVKIDNEIWTNVYRLYDLEKKVVFNRQLAQPAYFEVGDTILIVDQP